MSRHLYPDCTKCPYFLSVDKIAKLKATIESQQQEIERFKESCKKSFNALGLVMKEKDKALEQAREALEPCIRISGEGLATMTYLKIQKAFKEIEKALGGNGENENERD